MSQRTRSPLGPVVSIVMLALVIMAIYFVIKGLFWVLWWIFPALLIATVIIDKQVIIDYVMWIVNAVKNRNWVLFLGATVMTVIAFPLVAAYLFGKAMLKRKVKQVTKNFEQRTQGEFVDFEEMPTEEPEVLELPDLREREREQRQREAIKIQESRQSPRNDYEDLFE